MRLVFRQHCEDYHRTISQPAKATMKNGHDLLAPQVVMNLFMRDLAELNINEGGASVSRPAPSDQDVRAFESFFRVSLPAEYLQLLTLANGGHPETDAFDYLEGEGGSAVDRFYRLTSDKVDPYGVWYRTMHLRNVLQELGSSASVVAIAENGGGDVILLDTSSASPGPDMI